MTRTLGARGTALLALLWLPLMVAGAGDEMAALLESDTVRMGDTVRLVLEIPTLWGGAGPDLSPLERDFRVLGSSMGRETEFVGGQINALTRWLVELDPKRAGTLTIPAFTVSKYTSRPVTVTVLPAAADARGAGPSDVFVEAALTPESPYVHALLGLKVRLYLAMPLVRGSFQDPVPDNATVTRLGDNRLGEVIRDGRRFQVIERRYAVFPRTAGELVIPSVSFAGVVDDGARARSDVGALFGRGRRVEVSAPAQRVTVRPPPADVGEDHWLPARRVTLEERWSRDPAGLRAGEAVTRTITLMAEGLRGEQLAGPAPGAVAGAVVYPDRPRVNTLTDSTSVTGKHEQRIALVAERAGALVLPAVRVRWWDTLADAPREAVIPARTLVVGAAAPTGRPAVPDTATVARATGDAARPWQVASAVLAALWLLTLAAWYRQRPHPRGAADRRDLRRLRADVRLACVSDDGPRARDALLAWAALAFPERPPGTLGALAERLADAPLGAELLRLDRALYGGGGGWSGTALWHQAQRALVVPRATDGVRPRSPLPPLHPGTRLRA